MTEAEQYAMWAGVHRMAGHAVVRLPERVSRCLPDVEERGARYLAIGGGPSVVVSKIFTVLRDDLLLSPVAHPNCISFERRVSQLALALFVLSQHLPILNVHVLEIAFRGGLPELMQEFHDDSNFVKGAPPSVSPICVACRAKAVDLPRHLTRSLSKQFLGGEQTGALRMLSRDEVA
jgi:hypothetical protein